MKCSICGGDGVITLSKTDKNGYPNAFFMKVCSVCDGKGYVEPTNEEWFCSLSTEEKAKALYTMVFLMDWQRDVLNDAIMNNIDTEKAIEKWLKEIHNEVSTL